MAANLFASHRTLRAVIDCVLEGHLGTITPDDPNAPGVARLELGCYAIFGGDPGREAARELVASVQAPRELLIPDDQQWRDLLHDVHGNALSDRPMRTYATHALDARRLQSMAKDLPSGFSVEPLSPDTARQLDGGIEPHAMQVFTDPNDFVARGVGFGAVRDGRLASAATSYAISSSSVEIAMATREDFRRQGLARAVAARTILHCLDRGLNPEWSAANPASKSLALSLGYRPASLCDVFYLGVNP